MPAPVGPVQSAPVQPRDRLLAEAVRALEHEGDRPLENAPAIEQRVRESRDVTDDERPIVQRARVLADAHALPDALDLVHRWLTGAFCAGLVLMAVVGAGAARGVLVPGPRGAVVAYNALGVLLGVQTLLLLAWLALVLWPRRGRRTPALATLIVGMVRRGVDRLVRDRSDTLRAAATAYARSLNRWTLSVWTHGLWLAFNVGCLVALLALFSVHQYAFTWETTILSERAYVRLTEALAPGPAALGLPVPAPEHVRAAGLADPADMPDPARRAWAWFIAGSIVAYGALPRGIALVICAGLAIGARRRHRLDLHAPYYESVLHRLKPSIETRIVDPDTGDGRVPAHASPPPQRPVSAPAILALEMALPEAWPPVSQRVAWADLGLVDDRDSRRRVVDMLRHDATEPRVTVVACAVTRTPDRGIGAFLADVRAAVRRRVVLLLSDGHAMRQRGDDAMTERLSDWRAIAHEAGLDDADVIEIDLAHLTDRTAAQLAALTTANGEASSATPPRVPLDRVDEAFELIHTHCGRLAASPDAAAVRDLHTRIARVFGGAFAALPAQLESADWRQLGTEHARRMVELLPAGLMRRSRWIVAGAVAGAMGCVASAALVAPALAVTLPTWAILGAAVGAVAPCERRERIEHTGPDLRQHIDAAVLHTLVLALQGLGEDRITRLLEAVLQDEPDDAPLHHCDTVRAELSRVRVRLADALKREAIA